MRRGAALLLVLALMLGLLTGCGRKSQVPQDLTESFGAQEASVAESAVETGPETRSAGTFTMPYTVDGGFSPYTCMAMENRAVMQLIYEGLFTLNDKFEAEGVLCKDYTVSEDGLVYTFTLQEATFAGGRALTADDVVYSITQAQESDLFHSRLTDVSAVYTSGDMEVTVELYEPNDLLPNLLTFPIVPYGTAGQNSPAGTGPFTWAQEPDTLEINPDWWQGKEKLHFNKVRLYASASSEDTRDNFEIDNVHLIYNNPNASTAAAFHSDYELWNSQGTVMQYLAYNFNSPFFGISSVRTAVCRAIDRVTIAESVYHNFADPASLPVAPSSALYDEDLAAEYAFDGVDNAREALIATEYFYAPSEDTRPTPSPQPGEAADSETDGEAEDGEADAESEAEEETGTETYNHITMLVRSGNTKRVAAAKQVAQDLEDVGFTVRLRELSYSAYQEAIGAGGWDVCYEEVTLRPDFDLRSLLTPGGNLNIGGFSGSEDLNNYFAAAMENRGNHYDLYRFIMDRGYICPVMFLNNAVFTARGVFTGLHPTPGNIFYGIENIRVNERDAEEE